MATEVPTIRQHHVHSVTTSKSGLKARGSLQHIVVSVEIPTLNTPDEYSCHQRYRSGLATSSALPHCHLLAPLYSASSYPPRRPASRTLHPRPQAHAPPRHRPLVPSRHCRRHLPLIRTPPPPTRPRSRPYTAALGARTRTRNRSRHPSPRQGIARSPRSRPSLCKEPRISSSLFRPLGRLQSITLLA